MFQSRSRIESNLNLILMFAEDWQVITKSRALDQRVHSNFLLFFHFWSMIDDHLGRSNTVLAAATSNKGL